MRFRNRQTGEIRRRTPSDPDYRRMLRQSYRWERLDEIDLDQPIPAILEAVDTPELAQDVMEAEAAREAPRSTLLDQLAARIASPSEEE